MTSESGGLQHSRAYQLEMFEQSMRRNIIVCMATGSGKTNVAKLRIDAELQRKPDQRVWFTAPNVLLAQQQHHVLGSQLPHYPMRTLLGHDNVHLWRTQKAWDLALDNTSVIISTPQVLLDALRNAFVRLTDISLLVVDEAHHCHSDSPSAQIMLKHYHRLKADQPSNIPHILGLTASIRISRKSASITELENNLDAVCRTPTLSIDDYTIYVHRALVVKIEFTPTEAPPSVLLTTLQQIVSMTKMTDDPYYQALKKATDLALVQKRLKYEKSQTTPAMKELKKLLGNAEDLHKNVGSWAADCFVRSCVINWHEAVIQKSEFDASIPKYGAEFIDSRLTRIRNAVQTSYPLANAYISEKSQELIKFLAAEYHKGIAIIIFVERRSTAYALCELLRSAPSLQSYRIFSFVGLATTRVSSLIEVSDMRSQKKAFADFRAGSQDICIATSVAEEGIDIQAVNLVIRYDDPKQFVSFIQSRGRARQQDSKYIYFRNTFDDKSKYVGWEVFEKELEADYKNEARALEERRTADDLDEGDGEEYVVASTGAMLIYDNAAQHLQHFCTVVSGGTEPIYVLSEKPILYFRARVVLPSCVPAQLREAFSKRAWLGEKSARKDAAFQAYKALHEGGLLTDNLVPFQPEPGNEAQVKDGFRMYDIKAEIPVWQTLPEGGLFMHEISVRCTAEHYPALVLALPCSLSHSLSFQLSESHSRTLDVEVVPLGKWGQTLFEEAKSLTQTLFETVFRKGSASASLSETSRLPLLILSAADEGKMLGTEPKSLRQLLKKDNSLFGCQPLLLWHGRSPKPYIWHPPGSEDALTADTSAISVTKINKLQIYTNWRNVGNGTLAPQKKTLDVEECLTKGVATMYGPSIMLIPSILHIMAAALRAQRAAETVLKDLAPTTTEHLVPALLAKSASGVFNYERLEFLGDTYLKYRASLQMFFDNPLAMEGILSSKVQEMVSNLRLEKAFQDAGLGEYTTTQAPVQKHWKLPQLAGHHLPPSEPRRLQSKVLADVVESILGAVYLDGSKTGQADQRCTTALQLFLPETTWKDPSEIVCNIIGAIAASQAGGILVKPIERMTGYAFRRSNLLLEALTHSTTLPDRASLERLEFLGDAILDVIIKANFYSLSELGPDRMSSHRHALASHVFLAFCAFGLSDVRLQHNIDNGWSDRSILYHDSAQAIGLEQLVQFGDSQLRGPISAARARYSATKDAIHDQLTQGSFPWTMLRALDAPKVCSDVIESLLAAIYLDSGGSLEQCEKLLDRLGVMDLLRTMVKNETFVSETPSTRLRHVCDTEKVDIKICSADPTDSTKHIWKVMLRKDARLKEYIGREAGCEDEAESIAVEIALESVLTGDLNTIFLEVEQYDAPQDSRMTGPGESSSDSDMDDEDFENGGIALEPQSDSV